MKVGKINQLSSVPVTPLTVTELRQEIARLNAELHVIKNNDCNVCGIPIPFKLPLYCSKCERVDKHEPGSGGW